MPRPAGLVSLFRGKSSPLSVLKTDASTEMDWQYVNVDCQTEMDGNVCVSCQTTVDDGDWSHEVGCLTYFQL